MDWRIADKLIAGLVSFLLAAVLYDGYRLLQESRVNRALENIEAAEGVDFDHGRLHFARAWALQQEGKFEDALKAYGAIDVGNDERLGADLSYNLANLYFRRALQFREEGADDLALPLIELAKEGYRELLRANSQDWAAKYNLELALKIAPETDLEEVEEERNPEHNPRAAAGVQVRKRLP
ncbi:MAG: hypothetical protein WD448_03800 [Woeseia sp.]